MFGCKQRCRRSRHAPGLARCDRISAIGSAPVAPMPRQTPLTLYPRLRCTHIAQTPQPPGAQHNGQCSGGCAAIRSTLKPPPRLHPRHPPPKEPIGQPLHRWLRNLPRVARAHDVSPWQLCHQHAFSFRTNLASDCPDSVIATSCDYPQPAAAWVASLSCPRVCPTGCCCPAEDSCSLSLLSA